ncbi:MAG TPA: hypothetical protein PLS70_15815, partial [Acidobacteriota bacterium]|nr:hypothetical protein [Acidobacteriota bacterium]
MPAFPGGNLFLKNYQFSILHSQFFILHSSFFILHSQFFILNSSFFIPLMPLAAMAHKKEFKARALFLGERLDLRAL